MKNLTKPVNRIYVRLSLGSAAFIAANPVATSDQADYSQKSSAIRPYDADIGHKRLEDWKVVSEVGRKPDKSRDCQRAGWRGKPVFQGKKWQCQRHTVISCSGKYSNSCVSSIPRGAL